MENLEVESQETPKKKEPFKCWGKKKCCFCCVLLIIIVLFAIGLLFYYCPWRIGFGKGQDWQAVFLANGRAYFGKIVKENKEVIVLQEVYYLKELPASSAEEIGPQLTLARWRDELHGPADEMRINKSLVLFVEVLRADSEVVKTIEALKK